MKENEKDFLLFGMLTIVTKKACIKSVIFLMAILIPAILLPTMLTGEISILTIMFAIGIIAMYIVNIYKKFDEEGNIKGYSVFLHNGIEALCLTLALILAGTRIQFLVIDKRYHAIIALGILLGTGVVLAVYAYFVKLMIKKGSYTNAKIVQGTMAFSSMGVTIGMMIARTYLSSMGNDVALQLLAGCLFLLASLCLIGVINLYKYYIIKNNKELLQEIEESFE